MSAVLESNLERLLTRSYVAVVPSDECRARIEAALLAAMDQGQARRPADRPREQPTRARSAALSRWQRPALAAAAVLLAAVSIWWLGRGPTLSGLERLLSDGHVAWRATLADAWTSWPDGERATLAGARSEFATPDLTGLELDVPREGGVALAAASQASFSREPGGPLRIGLSRGAIELRRDADEATEAGVEWIVAAGDHVVHLEVGALSVALSAEAAGEVSLLLWSGRAWLETPGGRQPLAPGEPLAQGREDLGLRPWESSAEPLAPGASADAQQEAGPAHPDAPSGPGTAATPTSLRGRVLDRSSELPLGAYTLTLVLEDVTSSGPSDEARSFSTVDGRFEWTDIDPGTYALFAQAPGYASASRRHLAIDGVRITPELELSLEPGGARIAGRVLEAATGAPVSGAVVLSESDAPVHMLSLDAAEIPPGVTSTITHADGSFELAGLASGPQVLRAAADGFAPQWITVEALAETLREGVELRLTAPAAVEGRVTLENGAPASGVFMIVSLADRWPQRACLSMSYGLTDAQGHYRIGGLPAEEAVVLMLGPMESLDAPSALPRVLPVLLEAGRTATVDFLGERRAGRLHGVVSDAAGHPASGLMLSLLAADGTAGGSQPEWLAAMTDEQGAYEFGDLRTGRYQLFLVEGAGSSVVRCGSVELLGGGDQRYDLQLPGATIAGSLRDGRSSAPLPNGVVIVLASEPGRDLEFAARVPVGADGRFDCGPLPAGRYRVQGHANAEGWSEGLGEVELPAERVEVTLDLELFPGGRLTVLAVDEGGQPLPGAAVELLSPAGPRVDFAEDQLTGESGAFRVHGLSVGDWTVRVTLAGRRPAEQRVAVRVGEEASVRLALPGLP